MSLIHKQKSVTLIELVIAITILGILVLAFSSIEIFSRYHVRNADIRFQVQNEASTATSHMDKHISEAIGNTAVAGQVPVAIGTIGGDLVIRAWVDGNPFSIPAVQPNGRFDGSPNDHEIAYRWNSNGSATGAQNQLWYYNNCLGNNCNGSPTHEVISQRIVNCQAVMNANHLRLFLAARFNPANAETQDNPEVSIRSVVIMPAVATH